MTMHKALHPSDDVDRLYVSRKEGGRGLASTEDSVNASIQRLEDYIEKHEGLIIAIRNETDNKNGKKNNSMGVITTNKQHLTQENLDRAKKRKLYQRNRISPNSSTKQCHKNPSYPSENR